MRNGLFVLAFFLIATPALAGSVGGSVAERDTISANSASTVFSGNTPVHGFEIRCGDVGNYSIYVTDNGTASTSNGIALACTSTILNGVGDVGSYRTPDGYQPAGSVSVFNTDASNSHAVEARAW